jgi:hypothetical protein
MDEPFGLSSGRQHAHRVVALRQSNNFLVSHNRDCLVFKFISATRIRYFFRILPGCSSKAHCLKNIAYQKRRYPERLIALAVMKPIARLVDRFQRAFHQHGGVVAKEELLQSVEVMLFVFDNQDFHSFVVV